MTGPTKITPAEAYAAGIDSGYLYLSSQPSSITALTLTELQAGSDITKDVTAIAGFDKQANDIPVPRMGYETQPSIPGASTWNASSLTMIADKSGSDQRSAFTEGDTGCLVRLEDDTAATGSTFHAYNVRVSSISQPNQSDNFATYTVNFTISEAGEDQSVPAS